MEGLASYIVPRALWGPVILLAGSLAHLSPGRFVPPFQYNLLALIIIFAVGIPAGIWAALRQGTWMDPFTIGVMLFFTSVPVLVTIPVLQWLFAPQRDLLPSGGWEVREFYGVEIGVLSKRIILPLLVLTLPGFAGVAPHTRAPGAEGR